MDVALLKDLVAAGASVDVIARRAGVSHTTVRRWLRREGLETRRMARLRQGPSPPGNGGSVTLTCGRHGDTRYARDSRGAWRCLRCRSEAVARRRRKVKEILVQEAGGRCALCGYDRYAGVLSFHHLDPLEKSFGIGVTGVTRSLAKARAEAAKCVLLCLNCHGEVEAGIRRLT